MDRSRAENGVVSIALYINSFTRRTETPQSLLECDIILYWTNSLCLHETGDELIALAGDPFNKGYRSKRASRPSCSPCVN